MLSDSDYSEVLAQLPDVEFAFAYGSGVVLQSGYNLTAPESDGAGAAALDDGSKRPSASLPMVDLILAVDDAESWHGKNLLRNPTHYSPMLPLSAKSIASVQNNYGAAMWFNTMIPMRSRRFPFRLMKYGVICKKRLVEDLLDWNHVYVAGRLHKPVRLLRKDAEICFAMERNYDSALRTALLLLPTKFSPEELFCAITSLSYTGDPRMGVGENPNKVKNIVRPSMDLFRDLYLPRLSAVEPSVQPSGDGNFAMDTSSSARSRLASALPLSLRAALEVGGGTRSSAPSLPPPSPAQVTSALSKIVRRSASAQSLKGLLTAGFLKGSVYVFEKVKKRIFHK